MQQPRIHHFNLAASMEASTTRIFNRHLTRHPFLTFKFSPTTRRRNPNHSKIFFPLRPRCVSISSSSSAPPPFSNPLSSFLLSLSATQSFTSPPDRLHFDSKDKSCFSWNRAPLGGSKEEGDVGFMQNKGPVMAVAVLGWLGAEEKHLKRYVELYTSKGIHALSFVIPFREVVRFDSGRRVEERVSVLADELISWLSQSEEDGRERALLFHTFSNTGWFAYGAILNHLQARGEFMDKIRGCVVDSGADPDLDPQVWAAGFSAALLKKRSSATVPLADATEGHDPPADKGLQEVQNAESLLEAMFLSILEKFFSYILPLPVLNRRLTKIITTLSHNQPPCPQLYLYSTADKVIPSDKVESFIQTQKMSGRKVWAYNFVLSPHVDHYRSFPRVYTAELYRFLERCVTTVCYK